MTATGGCGLSASGAFPTTLALITALWDEGPGRVRAIALWTATGAVATVAGSVLSGALVVAFGWRIALLLPVPIALAALLLAARAIPRGVAESTERVDHVGGLLSVLAVAALVLGLGIVFAPGDAGAGLALLTTAALLLAAFVARQLRIAAPLYDLRIARRRLFWVPAVAGTLAFGALVGGMFVGQQYLQNILGYDALQAGIALIPAAIALLACAPFAAVLVERGTRVAMIVGYALLIGAFATMLAWTEQTTPVVVALAFALVGGGASFVMTAASRSLTSSTPVRKAGMASATSDLQSDLGGAVLQALFGAVLAGGFAHVFAGLIAASPDAAALSDDVTRALQASYASAVHVAAENPAYASQILEAARFSFVDGAWVAYLVGGIALVMGLVVVAVGLPTAAVEKELRARYRAEDVAAAT